MENKSKKLGKIDNKIKNLEINYKANRIISGITTGISLCTTGITGGILILNGTIMENSIQMNYIIPASLIVSGFLISFLTKKKSKQQYDEYIKYKSIRYCYVKENKLYLNEEAVNSRLR